MRAKRTPFESLEDYSILFADIKGFSQLLPYQQRLFLREVLKRIAAIVQREDASPEYINTWGDGLVAFFGAQTRALQCALHLRDVFRSTPWGDFGLPKLKIRIALHAGEVFQGYNPVTNRGEMIGREVNRAARIEPVTKPNHVYASRDFVVRCSQLTRYQFKDLGTVNLPKDWGPEELFVVGWAEHDTLDFGVRETPAVDLSPEALSQALSFPPLGKFGRRLAVSWSSKAALAKYCVTAGFWQPEDGVFLESGTIPVYLLAEMYRSLDARQRPRLLVTNNLGCAILGIRAIESHLRDVLKQDASYWVFPDDLPSEIILTNGRILEDYAATLPTEFFESAEQVVDASGAFSYLQGKLVSHIVMMVSRITHVDGPCAASTPMRRFKKRLLEVVMQDESKRMTILFEAEKLSGRRGWPAYTVDGEPGDAHLWNGLLSTGRVTLICACSEDLDEASAGLARREMTAMQQAGATCVLLDCEGRPVPLDV
jgi:class 3 adenylate cyclase